MMTNLGVACVELIVSGKTIVPVWNEESWEDSSRPSGEGHWPEGWEWFDTLYSYVIVGHSTIAVTSEKVKIQDSNTYEFLTGEYERAGVG
jgi:hypothetical protein